ncbi:hypothetical protein GCM10028895_34260 [Pontibacter rugosus]
MHAIEIAMGKEDSVAVDSTASTASELADNALQQECNAYFEEWKKLNAAKADYFKTVFLQKALANPGLSEQNRAFLLALEIYLNQSPAELRATPVKDQPLFPIFKVNENELGIFAFPAYDSSSESFLDISIENKILSSSRLTATIDSSSIDKVVFHPQLADSLFKNTNQSVIAYTTGRKVNTKVVNFGSYAGECLEYYNYLLDSKPFKASDKVLFGSRYSLRLSYKNYPEVDARLKLQFVEKCYDCPSSIGQQKTFATLEGVQGLYFVYADTFPLNNKLDTPSRALVMEMEDKLVYLWYQEVDLFGCSCL